MAKKIKPHFVCQLSSGRPMYCGHQNGHAVYWYAEADGTPVTVLDTKVGLEAIGAALEHSQNGVQDHPRLGSTLDQALSMDEFAEQLIASSVPKTSIEEAVDAGCLKDAGRMAIRAKEEIGMRPRSAAERFRDRIFPPRDDGTPFHGFKHGTIVTVIEGAQVPVASAWQTHNRSPDCGETGMVIDTWANPYTVTVRFGMNKADQRDFHWSGLRLADEIHGNLYYVGDIVKILSGGDLKGKTGKVAQRSMNARLMRVDGFLPGDAFVYHCFPRDVELVAAVVGPDDQDPLLELSEELGAGAPTAHDFRYGDYARCMGGRLAVILESPKPALGHAWVYLMPDGTGSGVGTWYSAYSDLTPVPTSGAAGYDRSQFSVGDRVVVVKGPWAGETGFVKSPRDGVSVADTEALVDLDNGVGMLLTPRSSLSWIPRSDG
jgi:hypothetical protein